MKFKFVSISIILLCVTTLVMGQVTDKESTLRTQTTDTIQGWKKGGDVIVNLSQTSLTNWASGGQNSLSINGLVNLFGNYLKGKNSWDNSLNIGYGLLKQGENSEFMKTDDKFDFLSKYGRQATKNLYYAALFNFKTQMAIGKDYSSDTSKISNFLAPAYITIAAGLDYKPNEYFSAFIAPFTGKMTIVADKDLSEKGAFGVEPGEKMKSEFGGYIRVIFSKNDFKSEFFKNIGITSKIDLFSNYLKNPQNIDVSWENLITMKVNKYISMSLNTHLVYDDDIKVVDTNDDGTPDGTRIQFKEIFGVGFSYKF